MKLVILAGGQGVRIQEFTQKIPKPLCTIGDMPMLVHLMFYFSKYGVKDFIICSGFKGSLIKKFFNKNLSKKIKKVIKNWSIKIVNTGIHTNTGGRIRRISKLVKNEKEFLLTYGDALSNVNIKNLIKHHKKENKLVTITVVKKPERFGKVVLKNNIIKKFDEKNNFFLINGGFMVVSSKVLKYLKNDKDIFEKKILEVFSKKKEVAGFMHNSFWQCVDNYRDWSFLNKIYKTRKIKKVFLK